jgi:NDP-sugar pyrophosphorylase family protein
MIYVLKMQMVILCGGLGTRLGDIAKNIPKSMININGRPFLQHQIEKLKKQGIEDILLCVGHLSNIIEEYFGDGSKFDIKIEYSHDGVEPLGPIGALKKAEPYLNDVFFMMYGDSYLSIDFQEVYEFFTQFDKLGCMVVFKNHDKYDKSNLIVKNDMVVGYGDKNRTKDMVYIDYGTTALHKNSLNIIPPNKFFTTKEFFSKLIEKQELLAYEAKERFYHIGTPASLEELKKFIKL